MKRFECFSPFPIFGPAKMFLHHTQMKQEVTGQRQKTDEWAKKALGFDPVQKRVQDLNRMLAR